MGANYDAIIVIIMLLDIATTTVGGLVIGTFQKVHFLFR